MRMSSPSAFRKQTQSAPLLMLFPLPGMPFLANSYTPINAQLRCSLLCALSAPGSLLSNVCLNVPDPPLCLPLKISLGWGDSMNGTNA